MDPKEELNQRVFPVWRGVQMPSSSAQALSLGIQILFILFGFHSLRKEQFIEVSSAKSSMKPGEPGVLHPFSM